MSDWPYFSEVDARMDEDFMSRLIHLREQYNRPMPVTSSFRTAEHNREIGGSENSAHLIGRAVDVHVFGQNAHDLATLAFRLGFTGIGFKQHGPHTGRFIHLDDCPFTERRPRPRIWSYR